MPDKAKAKSVIFLFMAGGPSHLDTFDPKPLLNKLDGQKRPAEFGEAKYQFVTERREAAWQQSERSRSTGKSGIEVSDLLPHLAQCVDDMAVIRSCSWRYGGAFGRAVSAVDRAHHSWIPKHGIVDALWPRIRK